jgi:hypothetical protein
LLLLLLPQVYEYDRNLLQQDAVQYIAAYKYELGTILAALNMSQFVRIRPRVCDKNAQIGTQQQQQQGRAGVLPNRGAAALLPKPGGKAGSLGRRDSSSSLPAAAGGFSMRSVLSAVSRDVQSAAAAAEPEKQQQQQWQQQQQQRSPAHNVPRPAGGESDDCWLFMVSPTADQSMSRAVAACVSRECSTAVHVLCKGYLLYVILVSVVLYRRACYGACLPVPQSHTKSCEALCIESTHLQKQARSGRTITAGP